MVGCVADSEAGFGGKANRMQISITARGASTRPDLDRGRQSRNASEPWRCTSKSCDVSSARSGGAAAGCSVQCVGMAWSDDRQAPASPASLGEASVDGH